jgi:MOSC domain-containing protein YiiM
MHIASLNIGLPQEYVWNSKLVRTSIFKQPVTEPVQVYQEHLAGDGQADLRVHGGPDKAVYAYPHEHYGFWHEYLPAEKLVPGAFGENLTTVGLLENEVHIGDLYQMGTAVLMAFQPRQPCFKLGIRLQDDSMVQRFERARRSGIYFRVQQEGVVQAGDVITLVQRSAYNVTIQDIVDNGAAEAADPHKIQEILDMPYLTASWRKRFTLMLEGSR